MEVVTCRFYYQGQLRVFYNEVDLTPAMTAEREGVCDGNEADNACFMAAGGVTTLRFRRVRGAVLAVRCQAKAPGRCECLNMAECGGPGAPVTGPALFWTSVSSDPRSDWNFRLNTANAARLVKANVAHFGDDWSANELDDSGWRTRLVATDCTTQLPLPTMGWCSFTFPCGWPLALLGVLCPRALPSLFGLSANGVWPEGDASQGATFRFIVDAPEPVGGVRGVRLRALGLEGRGNAPIPLVAVPEPEVRGEVVAKLVTPMDLPRELDLFHVLGGPETTAGARANAQPEPEPQLSRSPAIAQPTPSHSWFACFHSTALAFAALAQVRATSASVASSARAAATCAAGQCPPRCCAR